MIKRQSNIDILKQQFPISNFDECDIAHWDLLHQYSIKSIALKKYIFKDLDIFFASIPNEILAK